MIPAIVLAAGLATRLRPLSLEVAKAAMPVAGASIIERILRQLRAAGVTDAVLKSAKTRKWQKVKQAK